jgi:hypothetical protein
VSTLQGVFWFAVKAEKAKLRAPKSGPVNLEILKILQV